MCVQRKLNCYRVVNSLKLEKYVNDKIKDDKKLYDKNILDPPFMLGF